MSEIQSQLDNILTQIEKLGKKYMKLKGCAPENMGSVKLNFAYNDDFELTSTNVDTTFHTNRRIKDRRENEE